MEKDETAAGSYPVLAFAGLQNVVDLTMWQALIGSVVSERVTVKAGEAIRRGQPK
jgi:hypothetical protein